MQCRGHGADSAQHDSADRQKNHMKGWGNMNKTRMGKRVASLLLSLVMMLSLLPTAAYATMADGAET